jgi:hypothetical protein
MERRIVLESDPRTEKRLENIERMLERLLDAREEKKPDGDIYYTGPEFLLKFRCGRDKLKQLVTAGAVERNDSFGRNPRYRWVEGQI